MTRTLVHIAETYYPDGFMIIINMSLLNFNTPGYTLPLKIQGVSKLKC